jgi:hypothetical protein
MNKSRVVELLSKIENLLRIAGQDVWARQLNNAGALFSADPSAGRSEILGLYGGSGSLTDLVLYKDGAPLIDENNKLHDMIEEIYEELHLPN